jgi:hypothetical protein
MAKGAKEAALAALQVRVSFGRLGQVAERAVGSTAAGYSPNPGR